MRLLMRFLLLSLWAGLGLVGISLLVIALATPRLPEVTALADYRPKVPLRIMTADGVLIGEFGEERRSVVRIAEVPKPLIHAILAAEDDQFYQHAGIDPAGIVRSLLANLVSASKAQGGSTITMQVARNFYLSTEKTFTRKIYEVLLAFEIERKLSKDQILELYINQIYLGRRAYGFASAAQIYFGKSIGQLSIAEAAMLAGLPKAPSTFNPVANPRRAKVRQDYVLGRMHKLRLISNAQFTQAAKEKLKVVGRGEDYAVTAPYVAEMVRQQMVAQFPNDAYSRGLTVFTTIRSNEQRAAHNALRAGLIDFDRRQGWRGPEAVITLPRQAEDREDAIEDTLAERPDSDGLLTAVVLEAKEDLVRVMRSQGQQIEIRGEGLKFAAKGLSANALPTQRIKPGAVVRIRKLDADHYELTQLPEVEGAFIAIQTDTGALRSLVGGFDFRQNKFNHVTQAYRQPGSTIKPFVYAAALEKGFSASSVINDAPVSFDPGQTGGQVWDPKNYDGTYDGPISLRDGLARSKNMVSIRLLHAVGPKYAQTVLSRFGFEAEKNPPYLTLALGAGSTTPLQMATAYAAFANGGFRVTPYFIDRVVDERGALVSRTEPARAGEEAPRIMDERHAFLMHNLLQGVIKNGTGKKALSLGRQDLAGKTGTTNDAQDAWFAGYQPRLAAVAWVGYDQPRSLGERETGGGLALPIWISFMSEALKKIPQQNTNPPAGLLRISGEYYVPDNAPGVGVSSLGLQNP